MPARTIDQPSTLIDTSICAYLLPPFSLIGFNFSAAACPDGCSGRSSIPRHVLWYRKSFTIPADWEGSEFWLDFEGQRSLGCAAALTLILMQTVLLSYSSPLESSMTQCSGYVRAWRSSPVHAVTACVDLHALVRVVQFRGFSRVSPAWWHRVVPQHNDLDQRHSIGITCLWVHSFPCAARQHHRRQGREDHNLCFVSHWMCCCMQMALHTHTRARAHKRSLVQYVLLLLCWDSRVLSIQR